jgi:hypothetical protein
VVKRRIKGDRAVKRLLRRMPDAAREEMVKALDAAGDQLLAEAKGKVPKGRTGKLGGALKKRVLKGSLKLRVGLIGKVVNRKLYYGHIQEVGRKAQVVRVTRRRGAKPYTMKVRKMDAKRFLYGHRELRQRIRAHLDNVWTNILRRAAMGESDA